MLTLKPNKTMKKTQGFLIKTYYRIYLHFFHCKGDCDACYAKNSRLYLACSIDKINRRDTDISRYIRCQGFCNRAKEWSLRYKSFEKMLRKVRNPFWLMYVLYHYQIKRTLIAKASLAMVDTFIPYASERNRNLFVRANYILEKHGIESKEMSIFIEAIKEPFEMHIEGKDDTDKFNMYIASAIKRGSVAHSILPSILIVSGECYYGKWTIDSTYEMICDCIRKNCGEELLKAVDSDFESWRLRKLLSNQ